MMEEEIIKEHWFTYNYGFVKKFKEQKLKDKTHVWRIPIAGFVVRFSLLMWIFFPVKNTVFI